MASHWVNAYLLPFWGERKIKNKASCTIAACGKLWGLKNTLRTGDRRSEVAGEEDGTRKAGEGSEKKRLVCLIHLNFFIFKAIAAQEIVIGSGGSWNGRARATGGKEAK